MGLRPVADRAEAAAAAQIGALQIGQLVKQGERLLAERGGDLGGFVGSVFVPVDDWSIPEEYEKTVPQVFPTTAPGNFSWCGEAGKVVMTTFYPYQWDLDYANPAVFRDMTGMTWP